MAQTSRFQSLVRNDRYQLFILSCPVLFFGSLITHHWFVVNKKGQLNRWEVVHWNSTGKPYIKKNLFAPFEGLPIVYVSFFTFLNKFTQPSKVLGIIDGGENSVAKRAIDFIESSPQTYQYHDYYKFLGPNSNTYVQWVLNSFPEIKTKLPLSAIGKNFNSA